MKVQSTRPLLLRKKPSRAGFNDLEGRTFGRLRVVSYAGYRQCARAKNYWNCTCECGAECVISHDALRRAETFSCGCFVGDAVRERSLTHGHSAGRRSPEYQSWAAMKHRCLEPNHIAYKNYGGRGITICDRWLQSFEDFLADMGPRPDGKTLDRVENNGNYEPGNCRWATGAEQRANQRRPKRDLVTGRILPVPRKMPAKEEAA